jgi:hypothetical protein
MICFNNIERIYWTKSGSLGRVKAFATTNYATSSGTRNMKGWSSLNESMAIAGCHPYTNKTRLLGTGLERKGEIIPET